MADRGSMRGRGDFTRGRGGRGGRGDGSDRGGRGRGDGARGQPGGGYPGGGRGGGGGGGGGKPPAEVFNPSGAIPRPDVTVAAAENAGGKTTIEVDLSKMSMSDQRDPRSFPKRPDFGTQGSKVIMWANYFRIIPDPKTQLFRYLIVVEEAGSKKKEAIPKKKLARLIQLLLEEASLSRRRNSVATDFAQYLVLTEKLSPDELKFNVKYRVEGDDSDGSRPPPRFNITLELNGEFDMARMIDYLTSSNVSAAFEEKADIVQILNIIFGHSPKNNKMVMSVGANKHYAYPRPLEFNSNLGAGLLAWRGYFMSVRSATARLLLNVQVKNVAVYEHGPLLQVMKSFYNVNNESRPLEKFLKGLRVQTTHLKNSKGQVVKRTKTIFGLARKYDGKEDPRPRVQEDYAGPTGVSFFLDPAARAGIPPASIRNGYITVAQFFQIKHGVKANSEYPVINVGTADKPSYLPVDVCVVLEGQPARAKLSGRQTQQMINFAVRRPWANAKSITTQGISTLDLTRANQTLTTFGMGVDNQLITVQARILKSPDVVYPGKNAKLNNAKWNMGGIRFTRAVTLPSWAVLRITRDGQGGLDSFGGLLDGFRDNMKACGINVDAPTTRFQCSTNPAVINSKMKEISERPGKNITLVLVILPDDNAGPYSAVKIAGDITYGLHTICVTEKTFMKGSPQLFGNLALKFNLKLGGINQFLAPGKLYLIAAGETMVVGLDVTHPSPGSAKDAPSVAGMVASVDKYLGQWPAEFRRQEGRKEMVSELGDMLKTRLRLWLEKNNRKLPNNILIYRDGVSEGQYKVVLDEELTALKQACREVYSADATAKNYPRISIIVVGKRHHTRFYPTTLNNGEIDTNSHNTPPGTVVDRGVTEAANWDFFMQAHSALQGTARPAHYYVLHDEIFRSYFSYMTTLMNKPGVSRDDQYIVGLLKNMKSPADMVEDLTHNMSYLFGRATMAVSICPAAYYADLLCERARVYFRDEFEASEGSVASGQVAGRASRVHPRLANTMYYI